MKTKSRHLLTRLAPALLAALITLPVQASTPPTVAVMNFTAGREHPPETGAQIATVLNALLSANGDMVLVDRAELTQTLGEQELGLSGTVNNASAAKVGQLTGAKILVTGNLFRAGRETLAVAKITGTETSRTYGVIAKGDREASVSDLATQLATQIGEKIQEKADTLIAKVPTREDLVAKITTALGEAKRPLLSVKIPEVHIGTPTVDPAAETEIGLLARQCGFEVVDEKSSQKPRFEITGEAFSERGIRLGNLISCKARVEVKVRDTESGKLTVIDRQTTVAVDLSEQIAGKNALQDAGAKLAERILTAIGK